MQKDDHDLINTFIDAYKGKSHKKKLSRLYKYLETNKKTSTLYIKNSWEKEADITLSEDEWLNICQTNSTTTSSGHWREFSWKNIVRFFITPKRTFFQTGRADSGHCWRRCNNVMADHFHIFWGCPLIQSYWTMLTKEIGAILGFEIEHTFKTIYLGNLPNELNTQDKHLLKILLMASKKSITRKWLNGSPLTLRDWSATVEEIREVEMLTFSLRLQENKINKYWLKWLKHRDSNVN